MITNIKNIDDKKVVFLSNVRLIDMIYIQATNIYPDYITDQIDIEIDSKDTTSVK